MTSNQPSAPDDDVALALAAIEEYFAEQVAEWEAVLEGPAEDTADNGRWLATFRDRLGHVRAGGRLTDHEAAQVSGRMLLLQMRRPGRHGTRDEAIASLYAVRRRTQAVERGLAALGYDLTQTDPDQ